MSEKLDYLTKAQLRRARRIERSGQASFPQIVWAYERGDSAQIEVWENELPPLRHLIHSSAESWSGELEEKRE